MKVILKDDVQSLGNMGDMVTVSDGYARNYLIPKGFAIEASTKNVKALEHERAQIAKKVARVQNDAQSFAAELEKISITIGRKVGEQDKLYGSVTTKDIEEALADKGVSVDRKKIVLDEPIKSLGTSTVKVKLPAGVIGEVAVTVVGEE